MIAWLDRFTLFSQGRSRQIKNFMYGQAQGVKAAVFDYIYVTGSGKSQQTHYQTVVYLEPVNRCSADVFFTAGDSLSPDAQRVWLPGHRLRSTS